MSERLLEKECDLVCPHCNATPYRLFRRRCQEKDGTVREAWENILWPAALGVLPPSDPHHIACPDCGHDCVRR